MAIASEHIRHTVSTAFSDSDCSCAETDAQAIVPLACAGDWDVTVRHGRSVRQGAHTSYPPYRNPTQNAKPRRLPVSPALYKKKLHLIRHSDLNYAIAPELVQGVRAFMARVSGRADASVPVGYEAFLRAESPSIPRCFPRPMSPPLFPRSKTVRSGRTRIPPDSFDQILDLVGSPVEAAKFGMEEIAQENMRMLCGNMGEFFFFVFMGAEL